MHLSFVAHYANTSWQCSNVVTDATCCWSSLSATIRRARLWTAYSLCVWVAAIDIQIWAPYSIQGRFCALCRVRMPRGSRVSAILRRAETRRGLAGDSSDVVVEAEAAVYRHAQDLDAVLEWKFFCLQNAALSRLRVQHPGTSRLPSPAASQLQG